MSLCRKQRLTRDRAKNDTRKYCFLAETGDNEDTAENEPLNIWESITYVLSNKKFEPI